MRSYSTDFQKRRSLFDAWLAKYADYYDNGAVRIRRPPRSEDEARAILQRKCRCIVIIAVLISLIFLAIMIFSKLNIWLSIMITRRRFVDNFRKSQFSCNLSPRDNPRPKCMARIREHSIWIRRIYCCDDDHHLIDKQGPAREEIKIMIGTIA